jgi:hypothetical protein
MPTISGANPRPVSLVRPLDVRQALGQRSITAFGLRHRPSSAAVSRRTAG